MKTQFLIILLFLTVFFGCQIDGNEVAPEDFQIINQGNVILDLSDIYYYDFSSQIIYLKETNRLNGDFDKLQGSQIVVNGTEIYPLKIHELYLSIMPTGAHIRRLLDNFGDFAFRISYANDPNQVGTKDPRYDPRIISVLKKNNKYRAGLSIETESMTRQGNTIKLRIKLRNNDIQSYYHFDPKKMGEGLFHYFTNGLVFFDPQKMEYQQSNIQPEEPQSLHFWTLDWMSVIKGKESKVFEFVYPFENVPTGEKLNFSFNFPSLELSISNGSDLDQNSGRIWLGSLVIQQTKRF
ncbi:hypothetical protein [Cognataquiflexum rubidum]|uniref:hypothetical protein n=1 Tax=Cognataquiflexum rubidum TaxID=2922273 RepID=UPI001F140E36|nr:hypothetical protein [Cognataquiflexum rubidum]MCH6236677.1 hypothetical protein [Cognataquiflexum rubidum]